MRAGGRLWCPQAAHGPSAAESCAGQCRLRAGASHSCAVTHPRTTDDLHAARICYRCHPFYGVEVEVVRHLRRTESTVLVVRLPTGTQIALPKWMLTPELCDRLSYEDRPRIDITALLSSAGSSMPSASIVVSRTSVVQNLHQEVRMQNNKENRIVLQRKLRFAEEEIWTELPESTREHCRGLWRQLLESVLNSGDGRPDEREN